MGINIHVKNQKGDNHPDWDWIRYGNDEQLTELIDWKQVENSEVGFRPIDIPGVRQRIDATDWLNKSRYHQLLDYVEAGWWIYFSY